MRTLIHSLLLFFLLPFAVAAEVRLAILADPGTREYEALLATALSHVPVVLLERSEITRVLAEQHLALDRIADSQLPRVGQILGADGVVFLSLSTGKDGPGLAVRVVAVHPGVIISSELQAMPKDPAAWSRKTAESLTALLPKLAVSKEAAIPVAVVNLWATRTRPEAAELEREFTLLLARRLFHEPALFVLERDRLEVLEQEKAEDAASPFWTGRWLIDGAIEQDVADAAQLAITIHLRPAGGGDGAVIQRKCRRDETAAAVEALSIEITRQLRQEPTSEPWSAALEADRFWREARWAFDHEIFSRAAIAAESAWALGLKSAEVMALRIRAELLAARPELVVSYRYPKEYVWQVLERNFQWREAIPHTRGYRTWNVLIDIFKAMPPAERDRRFAQTLHGLELYRDHFAGLLDGPGQLRLATETLMIGGAMLEWLQQNAEEDNDTLRSIAASLREIDALATGRLGELSSKAESKYVAQFWITKAAYAPVWAATAGQTLAEWRAALAAPLDPDFKAGLRVILVHSQDFYPALTVSPGHPKLYTKQDPLAKTPLAREPAPPEWPAFVEELCASSFAGDRFTGIFFQHAAAPSGQRPAIEEKSQAAFWKERAGFAQGNLPFKYWDILCEVDPKELARPLVRPFSLDFLVYLLEESEPIAHDAFWTLFQPNAFTEEQAGRALKAVLAHDARVRKLPDAHWVLEETRTRTEELLLRFPALRPAETSSGALKVTRYWHPFLLPEFQSGPVSHLSFDFKEAIYAEGRLWVFGSVSASKEPRFLFGIDLKTFDTEVIPFPLPPPLAVPIKSLWGGFDFAVGEDDIFVCGEAQLSRYDRREKTWHYYPNLPGAFAQPWRVGDRLYVQINNSQQGFRTEHFGEMIELEIKTDAVRLLVSDRRQPAESPIDLWAMDIVTVRQGGDRRVFFRGFAHAGPSKYNYAAYDPATRQWSPLDSTVWKTGAGFETAHLAMAHKDAAWTVEESGGGATPWVLKSGNQTFPFRCEFSQKDRELLARNGAKPTLEVLERNIFPGLPMTPLAYVTPEGVGFSQVFGMPGFWFVPNADLPAVR